MSILIASSAFVAVALLGGAGRSWYGRLMLAGLMACWCGDMLGPRDFLVGLVAFLLAHGFFIAACYVKGIIGRRCVRMLPLLLAVTVGISSWLLPRVPASDRALVAAYIAVITVMICAASGASTGAAGWLLCFGAIVFYASDIFVARWKYVDHSGVNAYFCYPLYYTACYLFALSVWAYTRACAQTGHTERAS